jgi:(1->4)-alpha-D-glucan 1-alpha-D-glucosylmutase
MTVPGLPDFFQGTEFWDFSLVDPDNRRPVDYGARREARAADAGLAECQTRWRDGRIKQAMIHKVLALRRQVPDLFAQGGYSPLPVKGALEQHVVAFTRTHGQMVLIVVVPRLVHRLLQNGDRITLDPHHLRDSALLLPEQLHDRRFSSLLMEQAVISGQPLLQLQSLVGDFPLAVLTSVESA